MAVEGQSLKEHDEMRAGKKMAPSLPLPPTLFLGTWDTDSGGVTNNTNAMSIGQNEPTMI